MLNGSNAFSLVKLSECKKSHLLIRDSFMLSVGERSAELLYMVGSIFSRAAAHHTAVFGANCPIEI